MHGTAATVTRASKKQKFCWAKQQSTCGTLFLYISLPLLHDYDVRMPSVSLGGRKQATTKFLCLSELGYGSKEFNSKGVCLCLTRADKES